MHRHEPPRPTPSHHDPMCHDPMCHDPMCHDPVRDGPPHRDGVPPRDAALLRTPPHADDAAAITDLWRAVLPSPPPANRQLLAFLPCEDGRPLPKVVCVVDDVPREPSPADMRTIAGVFAHAVEHVAGGGLLVAVGRRGVRTVTERDVRWVEPCASACADHGVDRLGVWLCVAGAPPVRLDAPSATGVA